MKRFAAILLGGMCLGSACESARPAARRAVDPARATQIALTAFPAVRGHLAVARRTWRRGDSTLVQLAAVRPAWTPDSAPDSTLVVWIAATQRVVRSQWVIDASATSRLRSNER